MSDSRRWENVIAIELDLALGDLTPTNEPGPALAALERARAAWTRQHQQHSLPFCAVCGAHAGDELGCEFCPAA